MSAYENMDFEAECKACKSTMHASKKLLFANAVREVSAAVYHVNNETELLGAC